MKYGLVSINFKRPQIFSLWIASINRLRASAGIDFPVVVVSEEEDRAICEQNGIHFIHRQNKPVTRKWQAGIEWLRTQEVDYIIIIGSDDVLSNELFSNLISAMEKGYSVIGIKDIYFYGTHGQYRNKLYYIKRNNMLGVCKTIHRDILDKVDWNLFYQDRNFGMDGMVSRIIAPHIVSTYVVEGVCCDVKSQESLNKISMWANKIRHTVDSNILWNCLSAQEKLILTKIIKL